MFQPSVPSFASQSSDYYTAHAFEAPAAAVPPPKRPREWCWYEGQNSVRSLSWLAFRASSLFRMAQRQWLDRVQDCSEFATRHCTDQERAKVESGLTVFRDRLLHQNGEAYFGDRLPLLYGPGKVAMDHVCLRLSQDELPLHFRRTQLLEMTQQLQRCMSTGPAFIQAAEALDVNPEGLHSAFHSVMRARADGVFRKIFLDEQQETGPAFLESMEVHAVNRMRLEYGLPGGDDFDAYSFGSRLFEPGFQVIHVGRLRHALSPGKMAVALADRFLEQLNDRLPPEVPRWPARVDLNDHWPKILAAVEALGTAFAPVSPLSLMEEDEATNEFYWRRDPSLVQLDLLRAMDEKHLTVLRAPVPLLTVKEEDRKWALQSVDDEVFYVTSEHPPRQEVTHEPVGVQHLQALEKVRPDRVGVPKTLLKRFVNRLADDQLPRVPSHWLQNPLDLGQWLRRMTTEGLKAWLQTPPGPDEEQVFQLMVECAEQGKAALLQTVLDHAPQSGCDFSMRLGHYILSRVVLGSPDVMAVWQRHLLKQLPTLQRALAAELFSGAGQSRLIPWMLREGRVQALTMLLHLLEQAGCIGTIPPGDICTHLGPSLTMAMEAGHHESLAVFGEFLLKAFRQRWIGSDDLLRLLQDPAPGSACAGALLNGHPKCLGWYLEWIDRLRAEGALSDEAVRKLVSVVGEEGELMTHHPLSHNRPATLRIYLDGLTRLSRQGILPKSSLLDAMSCDRAEQSGMLLMVGGLPDRSCLHAWRESLLHAFRQRQISAGDIDTVLRGSDAPDNPILERILADPAGNPALEAWIETVYWLLEKDALTPEQVERLLHLPPAPEPQP